MRILVLGGTAWLGRHLVSTALDRGDEVVALARGTSGPPPMGARFVVAERTRPGAYDEVAGEHWDVALDVSRQPGQVREAATALAGTCDFFAFVSSASVYADDTTPGQDESGPLLPALEADVMESMESYGRAKVACEQHVRAAFGPDRFLLARAGLIGGPGDGSGRTGYWPLRLARPASEDGGVLVPDTPDQPTQVIDVRDLAAWLRDAAVAHHAGAFNVMGDPVPFATHLDTAARVARQVTGSAGLPVPVAPGWLVEHDVAPWMGARSLPLWLPGDEYAGFAARDTAAARAAGLETRPLEQTLRDTLVWEIEQGPDRPRNAGLTAADERALLAAWSAEAGQA